ncbi:4'-phosphopantetheinyl transferase superfamily protein [Streptomyces sp. E11-3]|uniref:4'-phosphopantetheinyl transferase family protein n=1 Tax=Streptomyces sp. E11-3 TaxID=3110112 RepID=UPI003980C019
MTAAYEDLKDHGKVHIWRGRAPDELDPADVALLSEEELEVVSRGSRKAAVRYTASHAALRRVLAEYLGVAPTAIGLGRRPCPRCEHPRHGRPRVDWPVTDLDFNFSRSGPHWLLAVGASGQLGVDVEDGRNLDVEGASALVMSDAELAYARSSSDTADRQSTFFRCWTRKEAVVKAIGVGIIADLKAIDIQPARSGPVLVRHTEPTGPDSWLVMDLPTVDGAFAALARESGSTGPVELRHYDELALATASGSRIEQARGALVA